MQHVKVDDEMKKRILQNVEKELSKGGVGSMPQTDKIVTFGKRLGDGIRQYAGIAAMFAILLVGAAAVVKMTGGVSNMSTSPSMSETAMEAPAATESAEMAEAPATEEEATYEEAAEATYDSDSMAEAPATEEAAKPTYESETATEAPAVTEEAAEPAGSAEKAEGTGKTETGAVNAPEETVEPGTAVEEAVEPQTVSWTHYIAPILLPIILLGIIIFIIWLIVRFIRRRK
ncbi:hypothetical protein D6855_04225 [Butyrivibrio sp. CB08]|nr:hypothetical protein D6855_04225 [Butyrivibrio sp. CB08]